MTKTKIFRTFTENLPTIFQKIILHEISPKLFPQNFLLIFKFSKNCPKTHREFPEKISLTSFIKTSFPSLITYEVFRNFETILVNVRFQFCLAAESMGQDDAILPDNQPIKLRQSRAG